MQKNQEITLKIESMNNYGSGVARTEDHQVVFVNGAVTGDRVVAKIIKINASYATARLVTVLDESPLRSRERNCGAPESCGGCVYRHIRYEEELRQKKEDVIHAFRKNGLKDVFVEDVHTLSSPLRYRNKAQYPVTMTKKGISFGFFERKTHKVIPSKGCLLQPECFDKIAESVCAFAEENHWSVYNETDRKGLLRHIYLRRGEVSGEILLCLVTNGNQIPNEAGFVSCMVQEFPDIVGILLNDNRENTNVVLSDNYRCICGKEWMEDRLCGLNFHIGPASFYQVNHDGAELLYRIAKEKADLNKDQTILDLFCGVGTIGLYFSSDVKEVIGVEIVPEAIQCAKENAELNQIQNASFYCADASGLETLLQKHNIPVDGVILDPPRKGVTPALIQTISDNHIPKIVYISCNADTQARDCAIFQEFGYSVGTVSPVDMFPGTGHVETVVLLRRKNIDDHLEFTWTDEEFGKKKGTLS